MSTPAQSTAQVQISIPISFPPNSQQPNKGQTDSPFNLNPNKATKFKTKQSQSQSEISISPNHNTDLQLQVEKKRNQPHLDRRACRIHQHLRETQRKHNRVRQFSKQRKKKKREIGEDSSTVG